jgi:hypothetical protein
MGNWRALQGAHELNMKVYASKDKLQVCVDDKLAFAIERKKNKLPALSFLAMSHK